MIATFSAKARTHTFLVGQEKYQKKTANVPFDRLCRFWYTVQSAPRTDFSRTSSWNPTPASAPGHRGGTTADGQQYRMFSLRKNIYHRPKIRTKSEFCALDHGERTIAVMLLCVRTPYDRRLKRTQTVFIQNFYRRSNCLSLLLLFSFFFLSKRKKNIVSPLKREKGGLMCRKSKKQKTPVHKKGTGA